jgi:hypothetical protein
LWNLNISDQSFSEQPFFYSIFRGRVHPDLIT